MQISLRKDSKSVKAKKVNILWEKGKSNFLCELVAQRPRLKMSEADEEKELSFSLAEKQKGKSWDMESFRKLFGRLFRITKRQAIHKTGHSWRRHYTLLNLSEKKLSWDSFTLCWDGSHHRSTSHWTSFWLILLNIFTLLLSCFLLTYLPRWRSMALRGVQLVDQCDQVVRLRGRYRLLWNR